MVQWTVGKSHVCVYRLDNFHVLIVHCVASLIRDDHKRAPHLYHVRCDIAAADAATAALKAALDGNFDMHMPIAV